MIDLAPTPTLLARFARDLARQSPRAPAGLRPDLAAVGRADVDAARVAWAARVIDEYRSVIVFTELLRLLADAEAPFDALCAVHRLIGDELRHTQLCAHLAQSLGGFDEVEIDLRDFSVAGAGRPDPRPAAARALEIIARELVVAEAESVHVLRAYRDATTDAAVREAFAVLLCDEARHAAAGRELFDLVCATARPDELAAERAALPAVIERDRAHIRAQYAASAAGGPGRALGASITREELGY